MPRTNRLPVLIGLLFFAFASNAQKFEWVNFFQGQNTQLPVAMSVDAAGNQYATFQFTNEIKQDSVNLINYSNDRKGLVLKQNSEGKALWYRVIQGTSSFQEVFPLSSRFNSKGNLLVFATSTDDIRVGSDTIKRNASAGTSYAYFLLEFNDTGKLVNSRHLIDGSIVSISYGGNKITNDKDDNLYISLTYTGLVNVYDSTGTINVGTSSSGGRNIIFKFSNSGRVLKWTNSLPLTNVQINSLKVDIHENVYAVAYWTSSTTFSFKGKSWSNPQTTTGTVFVWDKNGNEKSLFYVEASGKNSTLYDIAVYDSNSVYVAGAYLGDSAKFDTVWQKSSINGGYLFFGRYDINGRLKWINVEDTSYAAVIYNYNYYSGMTNFKDSFFYVSFFTPYQYSEAVIFDDQKYEPNPASYGLNFKVDDKGNILWGFRTLNPLASMATDAYDNFYFQGQWSGDTIKFGSFKASPTGIDAFLGKTTDYSINRGNVYAGPYCAGDTILVPFTKKGEFDTSNYFIAELSDEFGVFDGKERELGRVKSTKDTTVVGQLPLFKTASSGNYRIRIISTNPIVQSYYKFDKLRLLIYSRDKADPGETENLCYGDTLKLNTYGGTKWTWRPKYNMNDSNLRQPLVWPLKDTTYQIIIDDSSGCGEPDTAYKRIILRQPLKLRLAFIDTVVCDTSLLSLPMYFNGGDSANYRWKTFNINASGVWQNLNSGKSNRNDTLRLIPEVSFGVSQKLAVVLDDDCTNKRDTAYLSIRLLEPSKIATKFRDTQLCVGNSFKRKATSVYALKNYQWQWLDLTNKRVVSNSDSFSITAMATTTFKLTLSNGCTRDSSIFTVGVSPPLKVEIKSNNKNLKDTSICFGQTLNLKSVSGGGLISKYQWEWQLDGKLVSNKDSFRLQTNNQFPGLGGSKQLRLILKDNCTLKQDTFSKTITVLETPVANFSNGLACSQTNTDFVFTGTKTVASTTFNWNFEGEGSSTLENPSKRLSLAGSRKVTLTVNSSNGCKSEISKQIDVKLQSKADFGFKDTCDNDSVLFTNKSVDASNYVWNFGDGVTSSLTSAKHKYAKVADYKYYTVKLVAVVINGCSDSVSKTIKILESPIADFKFDGVCSRQKTNFTFTGMLPQSPTTTSMVWNFNNENQSNLTNPSLQFASAGVKTITLTLESSNACNDSLIKIIEIKTQSKAGFTAADACETDSVAFNNLSEDAGSYTWKFGDANTTKTESPKHLYRLNGQSTTFNVTLVANVFNGCSDSVTKAVTVNANPISEFSYTKIGAKLDLQAAQLNNLKYHWKFGKTDSFSTTSANYSHTLTSGQTRVCLKVSNLAGCVSETCKDLILSVQNVDKGLGFKLFPNPNSGNFTIEQAQRGNISIEIINQVGQLIYQAESDEISKTFHLNLASGVYLVRVSDGQNTVHQRMVVSK